MLTNIINQIQQERDQDRHISKKTGTNKIHDFTRIPGHRKVGPNIVLGKVSAFVQPPSTPTPTPTLEAVPDPAPIAPTIATIEPVSESTHTTALIQPVKLSKAAMKKKQKEEELAKKREQQKAPAPAPAPEPAPIEIESTVSE
jgi:hypothetical protein